MKQPSKIEAEIEETADSAARMTALLAQRLSSPDQNAPAKEGGTHAVPLLAAWLENWRKTQEIDRLELANQLGTTGEGLDRLALCLPPRESHFAEDVDEIAAFSGCNSAALLRLMRRHQVLATFAEPDAPAATQQNRNVGAVRGINAVQAGLLLAAREREDSGDNAKEANTVRITSVMPPSEDE